ncbi:MAG: flagellar motor protein MotB [Hyphomonadaceae bacterium]|nr:flagellar motor protein MotB [Hyphomonadaceae bacterium]
MAAANKAPIIIKRIKKGGHGHHGGAWKVAYADFVTAMMAFFLLMWLINTTSPEQKRGIADFFAPASVSETTSGAGGLLAGQALAESGARQAQETQFKEGRSNGGDLQGAPDPQNGTAEATEASLARARAARENAEFERAEQSIRQAIQDMPDLAELSKHVLMEVTPEGLRIQLVDQEGRSMFEAGGAELNGRARKLLSAVANVAADLPNRLSIAGHTDGSPPSSRGMTNWELSADRANAARRVVQASGIPQDRIYQVAGKADSEPLFPDDPTLPGNRRISVTLLREAPVLPAGAAP